MRGNLEIKIIDIVDFLSFFVAFAFNFNQYYAIQNQV